MSKRNTTSSGINVDEPTHRKPLQARSREKLEKILDATERLLDKKNFEDLTVKEILLESGVSTGAFYFRFKSKDDILRDLYRRYRESASSFDTESVMQNLAGLKLSELMYQMVKLALERMETRRGLIRTIALHMRQYPGASSEAEKRFAYQSREMCVAMILNCEDEISHPNPREASRLVVFTMAALCREFVLFPYTAHTSQLNMRRNRFIEETSRMMTQYLANGDSGEDED